MIIASIDLETHHESYTSTIEIHRQSISAWAGGDGTPYYELVVREPGGGALTCVEIAPEEMRKLATFFSEAADKIEQEQEE